MTCGKWMAESLLMLLQHSQATIYSRSYVLGYWTPFSSSVSSCHKHFCLCLRYSAWRTPWSIGWINDVTHGRRISFHHCWPILYCLDVLDNCRARAQLLALVQSKSGKHEPLEQKSHGTKYDKLLNPSMRSSGQLTILGQYPCSYHGTNEDAVTSQ